MTLLRAGRSGHYLRYGDRWWLPYPPDHKGISTAIPCEVDAALTEWCQRYRETKRDVIAAMVTHFLDNESEFEALLQELREVPRVI